MGVRWCSSRAQLLMLYALPIVIFRSKSAALLHPLLHGARRVDGGASNSLGTDKKIFTTCIDHHPPQFSAR